MQDVAPKWKRVDEFLDEAFAGMVSKSGSPMVGHSKDVGRILMAKGMDDITVFGGHLHDVIEDTDKTYEDVLALAREVFDTEAEAVLAAELALECCYTDAEYGLPKKERKKVACARWVASANERVAHVKMADVESNRKTARLVSPEFEVEYLGWAQPLHDRLSELVAAREAPAPRM